MMEEFNEFLKEAQRNIPLGELRIIKMGKNEIEMVNEPFGQKIIGRRVRDNHGYIRWAFRIMSG